MPVATCIATTREKRRPLPVDTIVPEPIFTSTHAITIDATPEQVWPWIAQMGAGESRLVSAGMRLTMAARQVRPLSGPTSRPSSPATSCQRFPAPRTRSSWPPSSHPRDLALTVPDGRGGSAVGVGTLPSPDGGGRTRLIAREDASRVNRGTLQMGGAS